MSKSILRDEVDKMGVNRNPLSCPGCGKSMPPGAVFCVLCGYDKRTGGTIANFRPLIAMPPSRKGFNAGWIIGLPIMLIVLGVLVVLFWKRAPPPPPPQVAQLPQPNIAGIIQNHDGNYDVAYAKVPVHIIAIVQSFKSAYDRIASQAIPLLSTQANAVPQSFEWDQLNEAIAAIDNTRRSVFADFLFRSAVSDVNGKFAFFNLTPGAYLVYCEKLVSNRRLVWTALVNITDNDEQHELVFNQASAGGVERFYAFADVIEYQRPLSERDSVDSSEKQDDDGDVVGETARGGEVAMVTTNSAGKFTITMPDGITYQNGVITQTEPDGITLSHSKGVSKIFFTELPAEFASQYGYDQKKANQYTREMSEKRVAYAEEQKRAAKEREIEAENAAKKAYTMGTCPSCVGRGTRNGLRRADGSYSQIKCVTCRGSGRTRQASRSEKPSSSSPRSSSSSDRVIILPAGASQGQIDAAREASIQ